MITKKTSDNNQDDSVYKRSNKPKDILQKYSEKVIEIIKSFFSNENLDDKKRNDSKTTITLSQNFLDETKNNPYAERLKQFKIKDIKKTTEKDLDQEKQQNPQQFEVKSSGLAATRINKEK